MEKLESLIKTYNDFPKKGIACDTSAQLGVPSALGALGRRFESCRPDSYNPSHRQVSQPVFFIG